MIFSGKSLKNIFTEAEASPVTPVNVGLYMGVGPVWGVRVENPSQLVLVFKYFDNSRKTMGQAPFVTFAPRLYNRYNHAHAPAPLMWQSQGPGPTPSAQKQWNSDFPVKN